MSFFARLGLVFAALAFLSACDETRPPRDGSFDAAANDDAAIADAAAQDTSIDDASTDASSPSDAGPELVGTISGSVGMVTTELSSVNPSIFVVNFDLGDGPWVEADLVERLVADARTLYADTSSGGASASLSEALAIEMLVRAEGATLSKVGSAVIYDSPTAPKVDATVLIGGVRVGVHVTRAVSFPFGDPYTVEKATDLLTKKLGDVLLSAAGASAEDAWAKSMVVVVAYDEAAAASIATAWAALDAQLKADTIVYVIVTDGDDAEVY